jgi:hypothetical protein
MYIVMDFLRVKINLYIGKQSTLSTYSNHKLKVNYLELNGD